MGEATSALPTGTVTFLFTDIEGSTRLYRRLGARFEQLLDQHRTICRDAFVAFDGAEVACPGDGFIAAFHSAGQALAAAVQAQRDLTSFPWPEAVDLRVRMGVHTGEARVTTSGGTYLGMSLHEAARVGAAGHGGQILVSEPTYRLVEHELPDGVAAVSLGPQQLKDIEGERLLYELTGDGLPAGFPPLRTLASASGNLPGRVSELFGRDADVAAVRAAIGEHRLTTLVGAGGMGKTRVALEVAGELQDRFPHGAWFVDLTPVPAVGDAAQVAAAVGAALLLEVSGGAAGLGAAIAHREALIVLDNCEHVIEAAGEVATVVLAASPGVWLLATSREALALAGEHVIPVSPLPEAAALALFMARAAEVVPGFELTAAVETDVARICARLDHLPLAIELAAKRVSVLSPADIAARLDDRFALLTGGGRRAPARQRTLEAAVDWSHSLLDESEQIMLRRLSVFTGGCDLDGAEAVCGFEPLTSANVLDLISALVDRSLVTVDRTDDHVRYGMLESIRAYAVDRVDQAGERDELRHRHLVWFAGRSWDLLERMFRGTVADDFKRMSADADNLSAAVAWALDRGDKDMGLRLVSGAGVFGMETGGGFFHMTREWVDALLADGAGADDPAVRCRALVASANIAAMQGDFDEVERFGEEAMVLVDRHDLPSGLRSQVVAMAGLAVQQRDPVRAMAMQDEAAALALEGGAPGFRIYALSFLASAALMAGCVDDARVAAETGLDEARRMGLGAGIARSLNVLAGVALREGDVAVAAELADEATATARGAGASGELAASLSNQAAAALFSGDGDAATAYVEQAAACYAEMGQWIGVVRTWVGAASVTLMVDVPTLARMALERLIEAIDVAGDTPLTRALVASVIPAAEAAGMGDLTARLPH